MSTTKATLTLHPERNIPPTRTNVPPASTLPLPPATKHASSDTAAAATTTSTTNASLHFIGTATTILSWSGMRLMTDPNFLHSGDHVHLGPGVTGTRVTNPAVEIDGLPRIDVVLLSHYHADHFDQLVEDKLRRDLPIITTPHAREHLAEKKEGSEAFTEVYALDTMESMMVKIEGEAVGKDEASPGKAKGKPAMQVTAMPGKHVPPGPLDVVNNLLGAVPPTNGWILELGYENEASSFQCGYRIYITGDTLLISDLDQIPALYTNASKPIDLMLIHLGGTTIPGPQLPLLMVTMDAEQGVKLMQLVDPRTTIPVHYDDYDVFMSPLEDFKKRVGDVGWAERVVYFGRGDGFAFEVKES